MSSRKILIIAIVVLFIIVVVGLYFLFFAPSGMPSGTVTQTGQAGTLPSTPNQNIGGGLPGTSPSSTTPANPALEKNFGVIAQMPVLDYFVNAANTVTVIERDGEIAQVANGQVNTISSITIQNILNAHFSYDGAKILTSFGDPVNPQVSVFDVTKKAWTPLAIGLQSATWSPSDYRVAYYTANAARGTETIAAVDASKVKPTPVAITTVYAQDLALAWPTKNQIVLSTKPSAYLAGSAWIYDLQKTTLTPVAAEVPGLATLWSGAGFPSATPTALMFSSSRSDLGGSLSLTNITGNIIQTLKFATLPSKCLFASTPASAPTATSTPYLYCGIPRDQNTFSISHLPDDYDQMALLTSDDIYRVNIQSGAIDTIFNDQTQNLDISDVKFFNNTLFFVNRYDQKLYGVQLN
jgi:hypothetical protein